MHSWHENRKSKRWSFDGHWTSPFDDNKVWGSILMYFVLLFLNVIACQPGNFLCLSCVLFSSFNQSYGLMAKNACNLAPHIIISGWQMSWHLFGTMHVVCCLFFVCWLVVGVVAYHLTLTLKGRVWNKSTYFVAIRASFWVVGSCDVMSVAGSAYAALQAGRGDSSAPGAPLMHFDGFPRERWSAVLDVFSELCNLPDHCHKDPLVQQVAQPQKRQGLSGWRCIVSQQVGGPKCSTLCPMVLGKCTVRNHFLWYSPKNAGPCVWFWIPRVGKPGFADMAAQAMCCRNHYSSSFCWGDPASWRKYIKMTIQLK